MSTPCQSPGGSRDDFTSEGGGDPGPPSPEIEENSKHRGLAPLNPHPTPRKSISFPYSPAAKRGGGGRGSEIRMVPPGSAHSSAVGGDLFPPAQVISISRPYSSSCPVLLGLTVGRRRFTPLRRPVGNQTRRALRLAHLFRTGIVTTPTDANGSLDARPGRPHLSFVQPERHARARKAPSAHPFVSSVRVRKQFELGLALGQRGKVDLAAESDLSFVLSGLTLCRLSAWAQLWCVRWGCWIGRECA
ncbi:hypothetical protein E4U43_001273 [Claviceps pusilla]|uniref:Uncharacterized protein n=1 Tax=Claviceps pusilla TaxID=123648 RepID=A0A9P7N844_9HYPO|nr:hypothetical protein E4U43_001273 [Claviceps pusilla]